MNLQKINMMFSQENDRQRIRNYWECDDPNDYIYQSVSPLANSCFEASNLTKYALEHDHFLNRNNLRKCLIGLNMNLKTKCETMQKLILASNNMYLKGNQMHNFCEATRLGLVSINVNITWFQLKEWTEKGYIMLDGIDYQNITYIPKPMHDLIVFKR